MLHISPPCVSPLFERRESPPAPLLSLISHSDIPWLTAVPDGIITPRFHSQLAQDPPPAEVAVPPPCPSVNINTNIWRRYVILYLWGDNVTVITQQVLPLSLHFFFLWWFSLTKVGSRDQFPFCSIYVGR